MDANTQPREKQTLRDDGSLDVVCIWPTIQGEGPYAGMPATFIRLAGCNFMCTLCDTDYTTGRELCAVDSIVEVVKALGGCIRSTLVVITGGEPFRQNLVPLVNALWAADFIIQIETNGSLTNDHFPWEKACIVCSPKSGSVHNDIRAHADAWKFVVAADQVNEHGFPTMVLGIGMKVATPNPDYPKSKIYIQPIDEGEEWRNKRHMQTAVDVCLKHGYRLCLQVQKIVGVK